LWQIKQFNFETNNCSFLKPHWWLLTISLVSLCTLGRWEGVNLSPTPPPSFHPFFSTLALPSLIHDCNWIIIFILFTSLVHNMSISDLRYWHLSISVSQYLIISVFQYLSISVSQYLSISVSQYFSLSVFRYISSSISCISLSLYFSISVSQYLSISVSQYLSISVSQYLSISVSQYLSISVSQYLSISVS